MMVAITEDRAGFVLASIRRHSMDVENWRKTLIAELHPSLVDCAQLYDQESVLVSCYHSEADWYVFTSQRVLGITGSQTYSAPVDAISDYDVECFKVPEGTVGTFKMKLFLVKGGALEVKCEAGKASMAPIYFVRTFHQLRQRAEQAAARDRVKKRGT
jgi:hypothetical protein